MQRRSLNPKPGKTCNKRLRLRMISCASVFGSDLCARDRVIAVVVVSCDKIPTPRLPSLRVCNFGLGVNPLQILHLILLFGGDQD